MTPHPCHRHHACGNVAPWWRNDWQHPLCLVCCPAGDIDTRTFEEGLAQFLGMFEEPEEPKPWVN